MMHLSSLAATGSARRAFPTTVSARFAVRAFSTRGGSSSSAFEQTEPPLVNSVYVHHVTKVVLQHLQETKADWLVEQGLERGLRLNSNGTAVLQFPPKMGMDSGRIWTTYDATSKQHWLCVYRGRLIGRFLLKDTNTAQPSKKAHEVDQTICRVVDEMVRKVSTV